jgi:orotate phosphoribosyltransferase
MKDKLLDLLRTKSLKRAPEGEFFTLASGAKSTVYLDVRKTALSPEGHVLLGEMLYDAIMKWPVGTDLVAGVELGGCPLASAVSMFSGQPSLDTSGRTPPGSRHKLPAVYVRKQAKDHGSKNLVEGPYEPGQSVLLLEDVVTSGGSSIKALGALKAAGLRCQGVIAVVDREQGGDAAFEAYSRIPFVALVTMKEVLAG